MKNIIDLLKAYDNYNVVIDRENKVNKYRIYAKEDIGLIVDKTTGPHVVFAINEENMSAAFWDYLKTMLNENVQDKDSVNKQLEGIMLKDRVRSFKIERIKL